jgi:hypothetical protein
MAKRCVRARVPWIMSVSSVHPSCPEPVAEAGIQDWVCELKNDSIYIT